MSEQDSQAEKSLAKQEWYGALVEDCLVIVGEAVFTSRWALVEGYWNLGKRICEENNNFEGAKIYGEKIVSYMTESLNRAKKEGQVQISERTIWRAIQFYKKYPDLSLVPEGKNASWYKVCNKYLPQPKEKKAEESPSKTGRMVKCPKCGYSFTIEDSGERRDYVSRNEQS